jgi:hypothetical protein
VEVLDGLRAVEREQVPVELVDSRVGREDHVAHLVLDDVGRETAHIVVVAGEDQQQPVLFVGLVRHVGPGLVGHGQHSHIEPRVLVTGRQSANDPLVLVDIGESRREGLCDAHV